MTTINTDKITSAFEFGQLVDKLIAEDRPVGFDIETGYDGPDREKRSVEIGARGQKVVGFSFTNDKRWARYVPLDHDIGPNVDDYDAAIEHLRRLLETCKIVAHNLKFEERNMRLHYGILIKRGTCTQMKVFMLSELPPGSTWGETSSGSGLKPACEMYCGYKMTELVDLFPDLTSKKKQDTMRFNLLDITPKVVAYACEDAACALWLEEIIDERIRAEQKVMYPIEDETIHITADMEDAGILIDWQMMQRKNTEVTTFNQRQIMEVYADLEALTGHSCARVNLNSWQQLGKLLYDELGYPCTRTSRKTGNRSTDAVALETLSRKYPVVKKILRWRETAKLGKAYLEKWPNDFDSYPDGLAHPNFAQFRVGTGRYAADRPSIQQCPHRIRHCLSDAVMQDLNGEAVWASIPDNLKFEMNFRDIVKAPPDHYLLGFDFKQVELRVMAGLSGEPALIEAFNRGDDPHKITAAAMLGVPLSQVTKEMRAIGKTMNFALLYGMGVDSLRDRLAVTKERAQELYDAYFSGFSCISAWMDRCKEEGRRRGYTISWTGRKYTVWELKSSNRKIYAKGERVLVNAPVQGGAADYMKIAQVRLSRELKKRGLWQTKIKLIMNQHDACYFYVHNSISPTAARDILQPCVEFEVKGFPKIEADFEHGQRWGSLQSLDEENEHEEEIIAEVEDEDGDAEITLTDDAAAAMARAVDEIFANRKADATAAEEHKERLAIETFEKLTTPDGSTFQLTITEMPTIGSFAKLQDFVVQRPGPSALTLNTPEGELELGFADRQRCEQELVDLRLYLPSIRLTVPVDESALKELGDGLNL